MQKQKLSYGIKVLEKIKQVFSTLRNINLKDTSHTIKPCDFLLFCHDVDRGVSINRKAYSPLIDSLKDEIEKQGFTCTSIAHPWSKLIGDNAYGNPIAINLSYLFTKILKKLFGKFKKNSELKLYEKLIRKAKPIVIITIGNSDSLCEAARNLNVFHAELLHGIGYTPIPWGWDIKEKKHLPQAILSLDPISTKTFSILEKRNIIIKEIPHPFLSRFQKDYEADLPVEWRTRKKTSKYNKEILITLQWGYVDGIDASPTFTGILPNGLFFEELLEVIEQTSLNILWRFRLHPVQLRQPEKYKQQLLLLNQTVKLNSNCEWEESTKLPLPSVLKSCSAHITMISMCSYEAAYMGIPSLALCPTLQEHGQHEHMFADLVDKGYLTKQLPNVTKILEWANHVETMEPLLNNLNSVNDNKETVKWLLNQT